MGSRVVSEEADEKKGSLQRRLTDNHVNIFDFFVSPSLFSGLFFARVGEAFGLASSESVFRGPAGPKMPNPM